MRNILIVLLLISTAFAPQGNQETIRSTIDGIETTAQSFLSIGSGLLFLSAVIVLGIAYFTYSQKGKQDKKSLWYILSIIIGLFGAMLLIGAIAGFIILLLVPYIIDALIGI